MGEALALVGRFYSHQLISAIDELAMAGQTEGYGGWGVAWCYGTLLEVTRAGRRPPGESGSGSDPGGQQARGPGGRERSAAGTRAGYDDSFTAGGYDSLRDIKPDIAVVRLTERTGMPAYSRDLQPFLRQESPRPQAFCTPGRLLSPRKLDVGHRITDSSNPDERFFLHLLNSLDDNDLMGSVTAMHERIADEPDQRFMLLNTKLLLVSTWQVPADGQSVYWLGKSDLLRVLSPVRLESVGELVWEQVPAQTVMVFKRRRYEAGQAG